jgi:hypothetical protein
VASKVVAVCDYCGKEEPMRGSLPAYQGDIFPDGWLFVCKATDRGVGMQAVNHFCSSACVGQAATDTTWHSFKEPDDA